MPAAISPQNELIHGQFILLIHFIIMVRIHYSVHIQYSTVKITIKYLRVPITYVPLKGLLLRGSKRR